MPKLHLFIHFQLDQKKIYYPIDFTKSRSDPTEINFNKPDPTVEHSSIWTAFHSSFTAVQKTLLPVQIQDSVKSYCSLESDLQQQTWLLVKEGKPKH